MEMYLKNFRKYVSVKLVDGKLPREVLDRLATLLRQDATKGAINQRIYTQCYFFAVKAHFEGVQA